MVSVSLLAKGAANAPSIEETLANTKHVRYALVPIKDWMLTKSNDRQNGKQTATS